MHDYVPDFIIRLNVDPPCYLIPRSSKNVNGAATERWVAAVKADGSYGKWTYAVAKRMSDVPAIIDQVLA